MSKTILGTERNREAIVELNDADLNFVSAGERGLVVNGVLEALCSAGLNGWGLRVDVGGHTYSRNCPK